MNKGKRWLAVFVCLSLIGGLGFLVWPRVCDKSVDGRLSAGAWAGNVWARMISGQQNCDPWARVAQKDPIGEIRFTYSINAYAGPASTEYYVRPDGRGYVYQWDIDADRLGWQIPEIALGQIETGNYRNSFTFKDKTVYQEVRNLLAPLRHATGPILEYAAHIKVGGKEKIVIQCDLDGYHSDYFIDWSREPFTDSSYFDNSSANDQCPALRSAAARLEKAQQLMDAKVSKEFLKRWADENLAKAHN